MAHVLGLEGGTEIGLDLVQLTQNQCVRGWGLSSDLVRDAMRSSIISPTIASISISTQSFFETQFFHVVLGLEGGTKIGLDLVQLTQNRCVRGWGAIFGCCQ